MGSLRRICFNRKAQALIEVAVFGAILITVLSFLIRYGMIYNQRQSLDMRAFRKALSESIAADRPGAQATVYLVEDKHIPDAGDIFGVGDVFTAEASANVVWGNNLETEEYEDKSDLPRIQYMVNEEEKVYTTAGYEGGALTNEPECLGIEDPLFDGFFFVKVPGYDSIRVRMSNLRVYYNEDGEPQGAMVMTESEKKDLITGIWDYDSEGLLRIISVSPDDDNPERVGCFVLLNSDEGEINPDYLALNNDIDFDGDADVSDEDVQGMLPSGQFVERKDLLGITDDSTSITSTTKNDTVITVTHTIRVNNESFPEEEFAPYIYEDVDTGGGTTWPVQK